VKYQRPLAWLERMGSPLLYGATPTLENTPTLVVQAMDLRLIFPPAILAGILLLRDNPWGYLLSSVALLKGTTLGLAVATMMHQHAAKEVGEGLGMMVPFLVVALLNDR